MFKSISRIFKRKRLYEIDSSFYLFVLGLFLGVIVFLSEKALWIFFLYFIFILSILIHDFIQILVAEHYGLRLKKFVLYPFGTKKMFGQDFYEPIHELVYALSGLATYLSIMLITSLIGLKLLPGLWPKEIVLKNTLTAQTFDSILISYPLFSIFWINFLLFIFNIVIIAIPMDGGRILKAILTAIFGESSASKFVPIISKIVSIVIIGLGLIFWDLLVVILGVFIYFFSSKEIHEQELIRLLSDKKVNEFVSPIELIFDKDLSVLEAFEKMKEILVPEALVKYDNKKYGVIDAEMISSIPKSLWASKKVGDVAEEVDAATEREKVGFIAQYMIEKNLSILPVIHHKTKALIGVIKRSDLADYLKIHKVL